MWQFVWILITSCCLMFSTTSCNDVALSSLASADSYRLQCSLEMNKTFLYFAFGSNLLTKRIHINNPSSVRIGIGKLNDYRLDFFDYASKRWKGAPATVVQHKGYCVWGSIYELNMEDLPNLDRQEAVHLNIYKRFIAEIEMPNGTIKKCYAYQSCDIPEYVKLNKLPPNRQPSKVYMDTIIKGAEECGLPEEYLKFLRNVAHNSYNGDIHHDLD